MKMPLADNLAAAMRLLVAEKESDDPLPPGPNYGPFGYFRLAVLIFAAIVALLAIINLLNFF